MVRGTAAKLRMVFGCKLERYNAVELDDTPGKGFAVPVETVQSVE